MKNQRKKPKKSQSRDTIAKKARGGNKRQGGWYNGEGDIKNGKPQEKVTGGWQHRKKEKLVSGGHNGNTQGVRINGHTEDGTGANTSN